MTEEAFKASQRLLRGRHAVTAGDPAVDAVSARMTAELAATLRRGIDELSRIDCAERPDRAAKVTAKSRGSPTSSRSWTRGNDFENSKPAASGRPQERRWRPKPPRRRLFARSEGEGLYCAICGPWTHILGKALLRAQAPWAHLMRAFSQAQRLGGGLFRGLYPVVARWF